MEIAKLEMKVEHLSQAIDELKATNKALLETIADIQKTLHEARGGWRVLMMVGGAGASIGSVITWVLNHITFK